MFMTASGMMRIRPWSGLDFLLMFLMWAVMMVGMMVPTAVPMTLIYAAVARKAASQKYPAGPDGSLCGRLYRDVVSFQCCRHS